MTMKKGSGKQAARPSRASISEPARRKYRCAIYTRKSSEEGLEQEFNSLDAQREACEAYVASQRSEGWVELADHYDDGGVSGGTLERPALKRLIADIEAGRVDVVVVYKIDRLSRSLMDFSKLVDVFERNQVTFVSITQSFNTTTSMGRLTLNILLSFAQFEREVIGERIRDKFAASRKRGMWMGGNVPMGYRVKDRKLVIHEPEARIVRMVFDRFSKIQSATLLARELAAQSIRTRTDRPFDKGVIYKMLANPVYVGKAVHKGVEYPGEHKPIISQKLWDAVHAIMTESPRTRANRNRSQTPALLKGLIFDPEGRAMSPTHTRKRGRLYRYYVSQRILKEGAVATDHDTTEEDLPVGRIPAGQIEAAVLDQLRRLIASPEIIVATHRAAANVDPDITEAQVRDALAELDPLWAELFPTEQTRIVQLLVARIDVAVDGIDIQLRIEGLGSLARELMVAKPYADQQRAA